uniref:Uncharacterized protein n=1 Tax=Anopheles farauti TaxID=69004 RepID=A0A182QUW0_9DIPT
MHIYLQFQSKMATTDSVNQSIDDGIPPDFLAEMHVGIDCLPVDDEVAKRILAEKQARSAESVQRFNDAWNIQPILQPGSSQRLVTLPNHNPGLTTMRRPSTVAHEPSVFYPPPLSVRDPRLRMGTAVPGPSVFQSSQEIRVVSRETLGAKDLLAGMASLSPAAPLPEERNSSRKAPTQAAGRTGTERRHPPSPGTDNDEEDDAIEMEEDETEQRKRGRTGRSARSGGHRSRRRSRSRSRTPPPHRRRRRRSRSRSRHRSRSRSRSSSRSSDRSYRRSRGTDSAAMMQSMMPMMMQMINQAMATRAPLVAVPQPVVGGEAMQQMPLAGYACGPPPPVDNRMDAMETLSVASLTPSEHPEEGNNQPQYDVSTELFLEGKLSFTDFLALKPSSRVDQIAPVNTKVTKRIKDAIAKLDSHEAMQHSARFLYVPPTYYGERKQPDGNTRSPLVWNEQNVQFGITSHAQHEVKRCEPFPNVNAKLKDLIAKLGLDEGVVSQQLKQLTHTAAVGGDSGSAANLASSRIQAITTVPSKPGSAQVRHMIERSSQTDGYACGDCISRQQKTYISTFAQTVESHASRNSSCQTIGRPPSPSNSISLDGLNANQIETVEAIVRFIRNRQLAGSIESVQYALRNDRVASVGMSSTILPACYEPPPPKSKKAKKKAKQQQQQQQQQQQPQKQHQHHNWYRN